MNTNWDSYWGEASNRHYWLEADKTVVELIAALDKTETRDVLDLGCGIGRHSICFAEAGFNVTAVDSSPEALAILREQVAEKGLEVKIIRGDYSEKLFPGESFDFVLAYNVIYHGYREDIEHRISLIHRLLRTHGLFFFTCPTRRDDKYGSGGQVASHTFRPINSVHPGVIHYFADEADVLSLLHDYDGISKNIHEHYWDDNETMRFSSYWQILARK